jgi:anti-anti-sigma factor
MLPQPSLQVRRQGDETIIRFVDLDRLDGYNSHALAEELACLAEDTPCARIVLVLGNIEYTSGSGLGTLLALNRKVRSMGGRLLLTNLNPAVAEVIAVTRLDRVLEVCGEDTSPAAVDEPTSILWFRQVGYDSTR